MICCFQTPKNRSVSSGRRGLDSAKLPVLRRPIPASEVVHSGTGSLGCADEGHSTALGGDGPLLMDTAWATMRGAKPASAQCSRPVPPNPCWWERQVPGCGPQSGLPMGLAQAVIPHEDEAGGSGQPLRLQNMALWSVGLEFGSTVRV